LTVASVLSDQTTAESIQLVLEYNPQPPFNAGSPDTAPAEVLAMLKEKMAPSIVRRRESSQRAAARLGLSKQPSAAE
jgi:cyclohexyl-isocyanide hydratase